MADHTRRRYLTAIAGAGAAGLAGCNGLVGGGGGGGGSGLRADAEFVPASIADGAESVEFVYVDIPTVRSDFPEAAKAELGLEELAAQFGIDVPDLGGLLNAGSGIGDEVQVLTGSFEPSDVYDGLGIDEPADEYQGYDVVNSQLAVADGVIVISRNYERAIDAKDGSVDRLVDTSEQWGDAVENASSGAMCVIEPAPNEAWSLMAVAMNAGGDGAVELTGYAHFESASDAESNKDAVRNGAFEDTNEDQDVTIESVSVDGSVVAVEATVEDFQF